MSKSLKEAIFFIYIGNLLIEANNEPLKSCNMSYRASTESLKKVSILGIKMHQVCPSGDF